MRSAIDEATTMPCNEGDVNVGFYYKTMVWTNKD